MFTRKNVENVIGGWMLRHPMAFSTGRVAVAKLSQQILRDRAAREKFNKIINNSIIVIDSA